MQRFLKKVAVVVGGNSGIGLSFAKALANEGSQVVVSSEDAIRTEPEVRQLLSAADLTAIRFVETSGS
jgi:NAD(P)-dependent dehydrogenase (short-subunit alcohol dehydrogenase family)